MFEDSWKDPWGIFNLQSSNGQTTVIFFNRTVQNPCVFERPVQKLTEGPRAKCRVSAMLSLRTDARTHSTTLQPFCVQATPHERPLCQPEANGQTTVKTF
jgi:hypothetical protein